MAALIAARVSKFITTSLSLQDASTHLWTDSQIVLYWIQSNKRLPTFVSHRVNEIRQLASTATWRYCPTDSNPADLLTRGINSQLFKSSTLWSQGPPWITTQNHWPTWQPSSSLQMLATTTTTKEVTPTESIQETNGLHHIINLTNYSSLGKLIAVTAYVYRFITNLKSHGNNQQGPLTATELYQAKMHWLKDCQQQVYGKEISNLSSSPLTTKRLPLVKQLRLFLDKDRYIRCGGRIHNAPISQLAKFPYLLPPRHQFTSLIIHHTHVKLFHAGTNGTLTAIRQTYWIPTARQYIKSLLRHCVVCKRHCGRPFAVPDPAPLPESRTRDVTPFTITGVDFTGALYVRHNSGEDKVYICLFTCATTRAVHLEIVTDLSTDTFLLAFRRFVSRKSLPQIVISDNASTYLSAAEELKTLFESKDLKESLGRRGVTWRFIPKRAPWYGGFWERLIGLTKMCLKKVLGRAHITSLMLETLVVEIEALMNDRPLTYVSSDIQDAGPLTPAHLLYGRRITTLPYEQIEEDELEDPTFGEDSQIKRRAKLLALTLRHFRHRWKHEYLTALREFHRASGNNNQTVKVGDIVLIHDDVPRINWRLAVIEKLIIGNDGLVRAANVRTANGRTNRPIVRLYPLEVTANPEGTGTIAEDKERTTIGETETERESNSVTVTTPGEGNSCRPSQRDSARRAMERMTKWSEVLRAPPGGCRGLAHSRKYPNCHI